MKVKEIYTSEQAIVALSLEGDAYLLVQIKNEKTSEVKFSWKFISVEND